MLHSTETSCTKKMSEVNEVIVLFEGYSESDVTNAEYTRANCTCTLIKGVGGYNIIVDTMTAWDGPKILEALEKHSVKPEHIKVVVSTHGHSDHIGNNSLFLNADWHIVGQCASNGDKYLLRSPWTDFVLTPDIRVIETPGHTLTCVSVIVNNTNLGKEVAIVGDLFERKEDIDDPEIWIGAGSENKKLQLENRSKISLTADLIVPGHGAPFQVTHEMINKLRLQLQYD